MKKSFISIVIAAIFLILSTTLSAQTSGEDDKIKKVVDFVKSCDVYFLATTELDQPRVRPFGTFFIYEGKIYFQTAKKKKVSKQLHTNPKIEICAYDGKGSVMRIEATAVEDERIEAKQYALDQFPELKSQYKADDGNTEVFYLKDATATLEAPKGQGWVETF